MSIRTILEINHDCMGEFTRETWETLLLALKTGDHHLFNNREMRGFKFLAQRHHSTKLSVQVE